MRRVRAGDRSAFDALVNRHYAMARRVAQNLVQDHDLAGELAQEAVVQAYLSLGSLRDESRFPNWLFGIVLNVCRSALRDRKHDLTAPELLSGGHFGLSMRYLEAAMNPQDVVEERELHRRALSAMRTLTEKDRDATLLFYFEQLTVKEIAAALDVSVSAVKVRLHKARRQLRERLQPFYEEEFGMDSPSPIKSAPNSEMIRVHVKSVQEEDFTTEGSGNSVKAYCVILATEDGRTALKIYIGQPEAIAISMKLHEANFKRPMTYTFVSQILEAAGVKLDEVQIVRLFEETFYAVARVRSGDCIEEIDARPSDALALALHANSPIYVAGEILQSAGIQVAEGEDLQIILNGETQRPLFHGPTSIVMTREEYEKMKAEQAQVEEGKSSEGGDDTP